MAKKRNKRWRNFQAQRIKFSHKDLNGKAYFTIIPDQQTIESFKQFSKYEINLLSKQLELEEGYLRNIGNNNA